MNIQIMMTLRNVFVTMVQVLYLCLWLNKNGSSIKTRFPFQFYSVLAFCFGGAMASSEDPVVEVVVHGAGSGLVNGKYSHVGINGIAYQNCDKTIDIRQTASGRWGICGSTSGHVYYTHSSHSVNPPAIGWVCTSAGASPAPTVTYSRDGTSLNTNRKRSAMSVCNVAEQAWKQRKFTDASIICEDERIPVHRAMLCAASSVFDAAFCSNLDEGKTATYEVKESSKGAVEAMLRFIYTGLHECPADDLPFLLELSVLYELESLCADVSSLLSGGVNATNVRARAAVLKRHGDRQHVAEALKSILGTIASDESLIRALI